MQTVVCVSCQRYAVRVLKEGVVRERKERVKSMYCAVCFCATVTHYKHWGQWGERVKSDRSTDGHFTILSDAIRIIGNGTLWQKSTISSASSSRTNDTCLGSSCDV